MIDHDNNNTVLFQNYLLPYRFTTYYGLSSWFWPKQNSTFHTTIHRIKCVFIVDYERHIHTQVCIVWCAFDLPQLSIETN